MQRAFPQTQPVASLTQFTCCKQRWEPQGERKQHFIVPVWGKLPWGHCKSWCIPGKKLCCSLCEQERPGSGLLPSLGSGRMWQGCREYLPCGCTLSCSCKSTTDQPCQLQQLTDTKKFFLIPEATEALENSYQAGGELAFPIPCASRFTGVQPFCPLNMLAWLFNFPPSNPHCPWRSSSFPASLFPLTWSFCFSSLWLSAWEGELSKWVPSVLFSGFSLHFVARWHMYISMFSLFLLSSLDRASEFFGMESW